MVIAWEIEPLVAVTVTVYCCFGVLLVVDTVSVEVPELFDSVMLAGDNELVGPFLTTGDILVVRVTVPEKPSRLASESVEAPDHPALMDRVVGLADKVKSVTLKLNDVAEPQSPELLWTDTTLCEAVQLDVGERVSAEEAVPWAGSWMAVGLKLEDTHDGRPPDMKGVTEPLYPFTLCSMIVTEPVPLMGMSNDSGVIVSKKLLT